MESTFGILASDRQPQLTAALTTFGNSDRPNFFTPSSQVNGSVPTSNFGTDSLTAIALSEQQIADFIVSQNNNIFSYAGGDRAASSTSLVQQQPNSEAMTADTDPLTGMRTDSQLDLSDPGNSLATARNIGVVDNSSVNLSDFVGVGDRDDYYSFTVNSNSDLSLRLDGLSAVAGIALIQDKNRNDWHNYDEYIDWDYGSAGTSGAINFFALTPGTYYVQVYNDFGSTDYNLNLAATPATGFSSNYGYGLVDANAAVARTFNSPVKFPEVPNLGGNDWARDMVNAPEVWQGGITGNGIVVAVVDSGVDYTHLDLDANIWQNADEIPNNRIDDDRNGYIDDIRGWDFVSGDNNPMDEKITIGGQLVAHGTHVAGAIAAERNGFWMTGVAPNSKIMPVRVWPTFATINSMNVAAGIRYAADNGADVINYSAGGRSPNREVEDAIQYATDKGIVVVMSAGNDGFYQPEYPARNADRFGIAAGAIEKNGRIAGFSNRAGSKLLDYVVAPGVDILSTTPNNTYKTYEGTSMAAPHVAGVAALVLNANPNLTPAQVEQILTATANSNGVIV